VVVNSDCRKKQIISSLLQRDDEAVCERNLDKSYHTSNIKLYNSVTQI
jgi:hypothetical protein